MPQVVFFQNQDVPLAWAPVDDEGNSITGGSVTVTATVTDPSGNVTTPTVSQQVAGSGTYNAVAESVNTAGIWLVSWLATGTNTGGTTVQATYEEQFQVQAGGLQQIVDLPSVRDYLRIPLTDTSRDNALMGFIFAASEVVRDFCGPFLAEQHTQFFDGGGPKLVPDWLPLISVQSVTEYYGLSAFSITEQPLGTQQNAFGFTVDYQTGELTRRTFGGEAAYWARGAKNVKVVYTAGRAGPLPWAVRLGALEMIRHLYQLTQQGGRPKFGGNALDSAESPMVPTGFAVPQRVIELLSTNQRAPGIA
jgi:hypothetical protein